MKLIFLALSAVCISACTTSDQANQALATKFAGQSVDSFFIAYGPPAASHKLSDGRALYTWSERGHSYSTPSTVNTTVIGNQAFSTVDGGGSIRVQCTLKIVARPDGRIERIDVLSDTIGDWQLSRCNEVFGGKPRQAS